MKLRREGFKERGRRGQQGAVGEIKELDVGHGSDKIYIRRYLHGAGKEDYCRNLFCSLCLQE